MAQPYGKEHILYLIITNAIFVVLLLLFKFLINKNIKLKKWIFRFIGLVGIILLFFSRYTMVKNWDLPWYKMIPDSICAASTLMVSISLMFFKENNPILHATWLIAIIGDIATLSYPSFIAQAPTILYAQSLFGLLHHSWTMFAIISILVLGYIKLDIKKWWYQFIFIGAMFIYGFFLLFVLRLVDAFNIDVPLIGGTILYSWFVLPIYLVGYFIAMIIYTKIKNKKKC